MKKHVLNLNNYTIADENEWDLQIIPKRESNTPVLKLYFKRTNFDDGVVDTEGVKWKKTIKISRRGTDEEYQARVDWWFDNAANDEEYKKELESSFVDILGNALIPTVKLTKAWLIRCPSYKRKNYINRFVYGWLSRECRKVKNI